MLRCLSAQFLTVCMSNAPAVGSGVLGHWDYIYRADESLSGTVYTMRGMVMRVAVTFSRPGP